jgi:competence protein ComEA
MPANNLDNICYYSHSFSKHFKGFLSLMLIGALSFSVSAQEAPANSPTINSAEEVVSTAGIDAISVDINTANASELATLVNIGLKKAKEIIAFREANGEFISIDDLTKVKGIGAGTVEKNRHRIQIAKK